MISIVSNVMASPNCETPTPAADVKAQISDGSCVCEENNTFAEKLKALEAEDKSEAQESKGGDVEKKDNGKDCSSTTEKDAVYGIAGILEGFGSLSYQSDDTVKNEVAQVLCAVPQAVPTMQAAAAAETMPETASADADVKNGLSEQIAWMLQTKDAGAAPAQTQDEILKTIGEYLDSLENVSTAPEAEKVSQTERDAVKSNLTINTQNENEVLKSSVMTDRKNVMTDRKNVMIEVKTAGRTDVPAEMRTATEQETTVPATIPANTEAGNEQATVKQAPFSIAGAENTVKAQEKQDGELKEAAVETKKAEPQENASAKIVLTANADKPANEISAAKADNLSMEEQNTPAPLKENVLRIVDNVSTKFSEGKYQFEVQLKPEFLGKVSIKLIMKEDGLKVHIKAGDDAVKAMLADQMSSLHSLLKEKGVTVSNIEVTSDSSGMPGNDGQAFRQNESGYKPEAGLYYDPPASEEEQFGAAMEQYGGFSGNSSLEFFA